MITVIAMFIYVLGLFVADYVVVSDEPRSLRDVLAHAIWPLWMPGFGLLYLIYEVF
jgi:hypothetical protein